MAVKNIGSGINQRRQNYAPWWTRNIKSVNFFLGMILIVVMLAFFYVSGMIYVLFKAGKQWLVNLMKYGQVWTDPKQLGLTWNHVFDWHYLLPKNEWHNPIFPYAIIIGSISVIYMWWKVWSSYQTYNGNEKGAEYFTDPKQLKKEYQLIPDRIKDFPGYGGIPLVHYNNSLGKLIQSSSYSLLFKRLKRKLVNLGNHLPGGTYGIDQTTVNNMIYGITRSGKGETIMLPLIDILSRAAKKCSMFVNDPKGEMFQLSAKILQKRGYKVYVLNLQNTTKSMSYNPLQIIIDYARKGYYDEAQQEANRLSTAIYQTIISNCGNTLYILSKDLETAKEISDDVGNTTVNVVTHSMTPGISVARDNMSNTFEGVKVIQPEELLRLKVGEMVVIRSTARTNQKGQIIRANPIFDTGRTSMPARWQILNQTFDGNATINDIKVDTPHEKLDLAQVSYNYVDDKFNDKNEVDQMLDLVFPNQKEEQGDYEEPLMKRNIKRW